MSRTLRGAGIAAGVAMLLFLLLHHRAPQPTFSPPSARHAPVDGGVAADVAPPRAARGSPPALSRPVAVMHFGWGSGPGQVGRRRDPESAAEGPMALAAGRDGTLWILDQVNGRILRRGRDGTLGSAIRLGAETAQDLRVSGDGLAVLDRLGEKSLRRYDGAGRLVDDRPLAELGVAESGGVTGLYGDDQGGLFVEEALPGKRVLRPLAGGDPLPGRPSRDGHQLVAAQIFRAQVGAVTVRGLERDGRERWATILSVERPVLSIPLCDTDAEGGVYLGVLHAAAPVPPSHDLGDERLELFRLSADGRELAHLSVPHPPTPLEIFRELEVADVGVVWWMHDADDDSGVVVDALRL